MNILNQLPSNGIDGHSAFPPPRPSSHHHHHQDACRRHLLPLALSPSSPASSGTLMSSFQPSRAPLIVDAINGGSPPRDDQETTFHKARNSTTQGLMEEEEDQFGLVQEYYFLGDHLQQKLIFSPEEPPCSVLTLAVSVSSAVKLESQQMDQIAKKMRRLTGFKSLRMENKVDPSLIAGFVISYGVGDAHVIDLSVKGRLAELEAQLRSSDKSAGAVGWSSC